MTPKHKEQKTPITLGSIVEQAHKAGAVVTISLTPLEGRKYHRASKINVKTGQASALCYARPRAIPKHERWVI